MNYHVISSREMFKAKGVEKKLYLAHTCSIQIDIFISKNMNRRQREKKQDAKLHFWQRNSFFFFCSAKNFDRLNNNNAGKLLHWDCFDNRTACSCTKLFRLLKMTNATTHTHIYTEKPLPQHKQ